MIGSNEALLQKYGKGKIPENVGVITTVVYRAAAEFPESWK